jgi:hypothetical protein
MMVSRGECISKRAWVLEGLPPLGRVGIEEMSFVMTWRPPFSDPDLAMTMWIIGSQPF